MTCITFYCYCPCHKRDETTWVGKACPKCIGNHIGAHTEFDGPIKIHNFDVECS